MMTEEILRKRIEKIRRELAEASEGRYPAPKLIAITKTHPPETILPLAAAGITDIGENRVQEFLGKKPELELGGVDCHLIGHLQTNKVKQIVGEVSTIQSVDSLKVANEISKQSVKKDLVTKILLEVNVGEEESKSGMEYDAVPDLLPAIAELPGLSVEGLMAIPPISAEPGGNHDYFSSMYQLFVDIKAKKYDNVSKTFFS